MTAPILAERAELLTATVEVKVLRIGGKQMTQSVFRQLQDECLFDDETLALRGDPWGWVNFHPDPECKEGFDHFHVVWQRGSELRRCSIPTNPRVPQVWPACVRRAWGGLENAASVWFCAAVLTGEQSFDQSRMQHNWVSVQVTKRRFNVTLPSEFLRFSSAVSYRTADSEEAALRVWLAKAGAGEAAPAEIWRRGVLRHEALVTAAEGEWAALIQRLSQLDQLFIAV